MKKIDRNEFHPSFFKGLAHRGLHDEKRTENGMAAFQNAIDHGVAFELDIHITKDDELIVCHDSDLIRTTGKAGIIEEMTSKEIRDNYRLLDGGVVPTLQEVLDLNQERCLIAVELKPYMNKNKRLAKKAKEVLKQIKDPKKITIISFDPRALFFFGKGRFTRGLLLSITRTDVYSFVKYFDYIDIGYELLHYAKTTKYRKKGGIVNVWTIQTDQDLTYVGGWVDTITFQHLDPKKVEEAINGKN